MSSKLQEAYNTSHFNDVRLKLDDLYYMDDVTFDHVTVADPNEFAFALSMPRTLSVKQKAINSSMFHAIDLKSTVVFRVFIGLKMSQNYDQSLNQLLLNRQKFLEFCKTYYHKFEEIDFKVGEPKLLENANAYEVKFIAIPVKNEEV